MMTEFISSWLIKFRLTLFSAKLEQFLKCLGKKKYQWLKTSGLH